jgi:hypothetical protein
LLERGDIDSGKVFEQLISIKCPDGTLLPARRIVLRLEKKTRDGDLEMSVLTNLDESGVSSLAVAELYRNRWKIETLFQSLTQMLEGEIDTLAYPKAALLGFAIALAAFNVMSTVQAALRGKYGADKIQEEVSGYYIANEFRATAAGMSIATTVEDWEAFQTMSSAEVASALLELAARVHLPKYKRHPRGPKKPVPKRTRFKRNTHVSTARLLLASRKSRKKSP